MSDDADTAFAFWTAPVGGFVLSVALTLPKECTGTLLNNDQECTNYLGFETLVLNQGQSWILGIVVGALFWCAMKAYQHLTREPKASPPAI